MVMWSLTWGKGVAPHVSEGLRLMWSLTWGEGVLPDVAGGESRGGRAKAGRGLKWCTVGDFEQK